MGLGTVLDERKATLVSYPLDLRHVRRLAVEVHSHDSPCPVRYLCDLSGSLFQYGVTYSPYFSKCHFVPFVPGAALFLFSMQRASVIPWPYTCGGRQVQNYIIIPFRVHYRPCPSAFLPGIMSLLRAAFL